MVVTIVVVSDKLYGVVRVVVLVVTILVVSD